MHMKFRVIVSFILLATVFSCSDEEFDDTRLLNNLSGEWYIDTPYIGLYVGDDYSRVVPINYPEYRLVMTPEGQVSIYLYHPNDMTDELISSGRVSGISSKQLRFDSEISSTLNAISIFEDEVHQVYSIVDYDDTHLDIKYRFKNSSGKPQDEGFLLSRAIQ